MPVRRREPVMLNPRATKYSARHDYGIDDSISRVGYLSNACLDDTYDAANRSRGRDNELMRNVNAAINSVYQGAPVYGSLHASRPPLYRVESRLNPEYIIYEPASFVRMRERVKDVQEKMDRQRQLLDRYLDSDFKPADLSSSNYERGTSVKIPAYYAAGGDPNNRPVSDLRRRLRRTIAKTKNNPEYYRD